jgi:predicted HTH transcriptional regulator
MNVPSWADAAISADLPILRQKGEGQELDFKIDVPQYLHELGKDIAAFGSSGGGKILFGIADDGTLVGLSFADAAQRDLFLRASREWLPRLDLPSIRSPCSALKAIRPSLA